MKIYKNEKKIQILLSILKYKQFFEIYFIFFI